MNEDGGSIFVFNLGKDDLLNTWVCWRRCLRISWKNGLINLFTNPAGSVTLAGHALQFLPCTWALTAWVVITHQYFLWDICIFQVSAGIMASCSVNFLNVTELKGKKSRHFLIRDSHGTHKAAWVWFLWTCLTVQPYQCHCLITWMVPKVF